MQQKSCVNGGFDCSVKKIPQRVNQFLYTGPLLPLLGELVWSAHLTTGDQEAYGRWVAAYQEASSAVAATPHQNAYLAALAKERESVSKKCFFIFVEKKFEAETVS